MVALQTSMGNISLAVLGMVKKNKLAIKCFLGKRYFRKIIFLIKIFLVSFK